MFGTSYLDRGLSVRPINISILAFQPRKHDVLSILPSRDIDALSVSFVAIGIGEAHRLIDHLNEAPWSTGLRSPAGKVHVGVVESLKSNDLLSLDFLKEVCQPHVGSIALPSCPSVDELDLANRLTRHLHGLGTFVVITGLENSEVALASAGITSDCYVAGDCSFEHHSYPARTIADPLKGRMICYELYDVLSMWAGRIGTFNGFLPRCAAMHIEVPASVGSLKDIDRAAMQFRKAPHANLDELVSVIPMSSDMVSCLTCFRHSSVLNQACVSRYKPDLF